jgi:hypothetical protein
MQTETLLHFLHEPPLNSALNELNSFSHSTGLFKIKLYRTVILPVVLYGCETWSLTLREESKLRVFENMVLRRIFGPRRDEVTGEWRRLHSEELNNLPTYGALPYAGSST